MVVADDADDAAHDDATQAPAEISSAASFAQLSSLAPPAATADAGEAIAVAPAEAAPAEAAADSEVAEAEAVPPSADGAADAEDGGIAPPPASRMPHPDSSSTHVEEAAPAAAQSDTSVVLPHLVEDESDPEMGMALAPPPVDVGEACSEAATAPPPPSPPAMAEWAMSSSEAVRQHDGDIALPPASPLPRPGSVEAPTLPPSPPGQPGGSGPVQQHDPRDGVAERHIADDDYGVDAAADGDDDGDEEDEEEERWLMMLLAMDVSGDEMIDEIEESNPQPGSLTESVLVLLRAGIPPDEIGDELGVGQRAPAADPPAPRQVEDELPAQQPQTQMLEVEVPQGMAGGMMLHVQAPTGLMEVQIPPGLRAGQSFHMQVELPALPAGGSGGSSARAAGSSAKLPPSPRLHRDDARSHRSGEDDDEPSTERPPRTGGPLGRGRGRAGYNTLSPDEMGGGLLDDGDEGGIEMAVGRARARGRQGVTRRTDDDGGGDEESPPRGGVRRGRGARWRPLSRDGDGDGANARPRSRLLGLLLTPTFLCVSVLLALLLIASVDFLPPLHHALVYNSLFKTIAPTTLSTAGLHFIGPISKLYLIPATVQTLTFGLTGESPGDRGPVWARADTGLPIVLTCTIQWRYDQSPRPLSLPPPQVCPPHLTVPWCRVAGTIRAGSPPSGLTSRPTLQPRRIRARTTPRSR